jgi:TonB family protein
MNSFERFYNDYMAWRAMRAFGLFAIIIAGGIAWGWFLGFSNILDYAKLQDIRKVELHSLDGREFSSESSLGDSRSCRALVDVGSGKTSVYSTTHGNNPEDQAAAELFCKKHLASIGQWQEHQESRSTGLLEKSFWVVLTILAFLSGLALTLGIIVLVDELGFGGGILLKLSAIPVLLWYAASLVIFCIGTFDERLESWSDGKETVKVQRLWLTNDGKAYYRPHTLLGWTDTETMRLASGAIPNTLLAQFSAPASAASASDHIGTGQLTRPSLSGELKLTEIDGVDSETGDSEPDASDRSADDVEYEPATIKHAPAPRYPPAALSAGIIGTVGLSIDIDDQGRVTNVVVKDSSRNRDLDRAALDAARKWLFNPALENGRPVANKIWVPVAFGDDGERATIDYVDESVGDSESEAGTTDDLVPSAPASASQHPVPSFACVGTGLSASETAICGSHDLAALDVELAKAYSTKLKITDASSRSNVQQNQRTWLARRDAECGGDVACLQSSLARRLAELQ